LFSVVCGDVSRVAVNRNTGIFLHRSLWVLKEDDAVLGAAILAFDGSDYTECCLEEYDAI
jgi:hypothetical protein